MPESADADRVQRSFNALSEADQELALEFLELLAKHGKRR